MKNVVLLLAVLFAFIQSYSQVIPNNSFETWESFNNGAYEEPTPWHTTNPYTSLVGQVNVTKSDDATDGNYSARLETVEINYLTFTFYAPGLLTLADFNVNFLTQQYSISGGLPLQKRVTQLNGKFKYQPAENDSASVLIYCFRHPQGENIDTIGVGLTYLHSVENWSDFTVYMQYLNDHTPDTFNIVILSAGTFQLGYMPPGSVLYVDELSVDTTVSNVASNMSLEAALYPNPASGNVTINLNKSVRTGILTIFDMTGNMIKEENFTGATVITDISNLSNGIYAFKITGGDKLPVTGTFIKH